MDTLMINRNGVVFEVDRKADQYGQHRVVATLDGQSEIGQIPGIPSQAYPRIEFNFVTATWLHQRADSSGWVVDDYETDEDLKHRSPDICEFTLTDDEIAKINTWRIAPGKTRQETQPPVGSNTRPVFAIGGLNKGDGTEVPIPWPTTGRVCRICGTSEGHGAMFTTITGGDVCDDCI